MGFQQRVCSAALPGEEALQARSGLDFCGHSQMHMRRPLSCESFDNTFLIFRLVAMMSGMAALSS